MEPEAPDSPSEAPEQRIQSTAVAMKEFEYSGRAYRQGEEGSPWIATFVGVAEDVTEWAGVPRRSEHNVGNFQRLLNPNRVRAAKDFFSNPSNTSPTSILLAIQQQDESSYSR